jgi:hypothetical protein
MLRFCNSIENGKSNYAANRCLQIMQMLKQYAFPPRRGDAAKRFKQSSGADRLIPTQAWNF